ncbi:MAG: UDP-N-acetylglucosamine 2-epimerase [Candidatus Saganbacteria bacterium]|uniref:UDP-N-acetylglucosamine 2-epimerase n=1 Tax=Candidatus Saganbacteria bacterium TaxID=2575572 RepID=A0A833NSQ6_UNCSA|nr:MAG: UDP-N-acetylglucosamine 2-epimerase [Candidatus Saganbacteria bacterium]
MKRRKVCVVTGTRAEYGILKPLLEKIINSNKLELSLMVTGLHLLKKYGVTINEIKRDGFKIDAIINMYDNAPKNNMSYYGYALGRGIKGFANKLSMLKPHLLVVFGDRLEPLAATLAAALLQIPIVHIHGGDKTDSGHIDESIRHAITRFANIHIPATKGHAARLLAMGEESWRIFRVGSLGLDSIIETETSKDSLRKLGINLKEKIIVCLFHSVHLEKNNAGRQMREIMGAIKELKMQTVIIYPNNDPGSKDIIAEIEKNKKLPFVKVFPSLCHPEYISLLRYADVLIGNSSSGILEAPTLKLPVINIGSRNMGREHGKNVIFVAARKQLIIYATKKALFDNVFRREVQNCQNPYGKGEASEQIVRVLSNIKINKYLSQKKITI